MCSLHYKQTKQETIANWLERHNCSLKLDSVGVRSDQRLMAQQMSDTTSVGGSCRTSDSGQASSWSLPTRETLETIRTTELSCPPRMRSPQWQPWCESLLASTLKIGHGNHFARSPESWVGATARSASPSFGWRGR